MTISLRAAAAVLLIGRAASATEFAPEIPMAFEPASTSATAITGPVILSNSWIVFANGERLDLELIRRIDDSETSPQLFRLSGEIAPLLQGNTLCGDNAPTFLSVGQATDMGLVFLHLSFYEAGNEPGPESRGSVPCATYNYVPPAAWLASIQPDELGLGREAPEDPVDTGDWIVSRKTNPVDDSPTVSISLLAESGESRYGEKVAFVARCKSNTTDAYAVWNTYVGDDSSTPYAEWKRVTVRIGDNVATNEQWDVSTDKRATFAPDWAGDLLKRMVKSDRLVLQMTPYGENPITAIFNTSGLGVA